MQQGGAGEENKGEQNRTARAGARGSHEMHWPLTRERAWWYTMQVALESSSKFGSDNEKEKAGGNVPAGRRGFVLRFCYGPSGAAAWQDMVSGALQVEHHQRCMLPAGRRPPHHATVSRCHLGRSPSGACCHGTAASSSHQVATSTSSSCHRVQHCIHQLPLQE